MTDAPQIPAAFLRAKELVDDLVNDPAIGSQIRAKVKEKYPDAQVVKEDARLAALTAPLEAENKALKERLDKIEADRTKERQEQTERETERTLKSKLDSARERFNLTDEGLDKVVARMKETGNYTDPEAAAAWVAQQTPPPKPQSPGWAPQSMNLFGTKHADEQFALLHKDPLAYQDAQLAEFVQDPDKYVRETFGQAA